MKSNNKIFRQGKKLLKNEKERDQKQNVPFKEVVYTQVKM